MGQVNFSDDDFDGDVFFVLTGQITVELANAFGSVFAEAIGNLVVASADVDVGDHKHNSFFFIIAHNLATQLS